MAQCGWCRSALVTAKVVDLEAWVCPTAACRARQLACAQVSSQGKARRCHFVPLPSQVPLWESTARWLLWGGQGGPGKSTGARRYAYDRSLRVEGHETLILRENWEQLDKTHLRKMEREVEALGGKFYKSDRKAEFGTGSTASVIDCGHMADMDAVSRYLSTEYNLILPDEASLYPTDSDGTTPLAELSTRARKVGRHRETGAAVPARFIPLTNPGGPSAPWLAAMFIHHQPDFDRYPALRATYRAEEWQYLPARLDDNPYLPPEYADNLAVLNKTRYQQIRHGDWNVFAGQFFSEWTTVTHTRTLELPRGLEYFCSMDWGYNAPGVILWWACLPDGHYHLVQEYKFQQETAETVAKGWHQRNTALGKIRPRCVVADPSMWAKTGHGRGEAIAETLQRCHLPMRRGDNDRLNGWQRVHELLRFDSEGVPWLTVDPVGCPYLVRSLPAQRSDRLHPDDLDTGGDDHAVDALRYGAMSRPTPTRFSTPRPKIHPMMAEILNAPQGRRLGTDAVRGLHA